MSEQPLSKQERADELIEEFNRVPNSEEEAQLHLSYVINQLRYGLPVAIAKADGLLPTTAYNSMAIVPISTNEMYTNYGVKNKLLWLKDKKVIELAGGSKSRIDFSNIPLSADPSGARVAAIRGANVINVDLGEEYVEDSNLYQHIQADVLPYLFSDFDSANESLKPVFNLKQDFMMLSGVVYYRNPSLHFLLAASKYYPDLALDKEDISVLINQLNRLGMIYGSGAFAEFLAIDESSRNLELIYRYKLLRSKIMDTTLHRARQVLNIGGVVNIENDTFGINTVNGLAVYVSDPLRGHVIDRIIK